ncbi:MAG TPA: DinB family protein, partial [Anaerolineales bacterium]|nr:DinB family protein [Anaerolineales bacterium]
MDSKERNEKIDLYGNGFAMLVEVLKDIPLEMWQFKPEPTEWSIHEIIIHLADSESNAALRARMLTVEPGGTLMGYDQDKWANELNYHEQDIEDALEVTRLARKTTYELLKKQPDEVFEHIVMHPEYKEPYTFDNWIDIYSAHIPGHIEQISNNYKLWKEQ